MATHRRATAAVLLTLVGVLATTGCAPTPTPTASPSASGFTSDDAAFAAAEATYRAYVDATNAIDLSRPATFEPAFAWLSGEALDSSRKSLSAMHSDRWTVGGSSSIVAMEHGGRQSDGSVSLLVCLDVSAVTLTDPSGVSQVGQRPNQQSLTVKVARQADEVWRITSFSGRTGAPQCEE